MCQRENLSPPCFWYQKRWWPEASLKSEHLHSFVDAPHFKMKGIHTLKSLVLEGDWLVKVDLKDAYFSVPISQENKKFLCFQFEDKSYQFNCLPFGLASAPQDPECSSQSEARDMDGCLHREHSPDGRYRGESQRLSIQPAWASQ